jgi:FkbM family methyltransferase
MEIMSKFLMRLMGWLPAGLAGWILKQRSESPTLKRLSEPFANLLRNQPLRIGTGVGEGLFINVGNSAAAYALGTFKPELQNFLSSVVKAGSVFYDVGANVGFFSLLAAKLVGPQGKVICFEPLRDNLIRLRENAERNEFYNVQILPLALGGANEERIFQVSERPTWGKLKGVGSETPDKYMSDIKVMVRRLDDLLSESAIQPPDFVKIDVEGAEVEVVEGARETLLRHGPTLMIELHGTGKPLTHIFSEIAYCVLPLSGSSNNVAEAHWNAMILAFPFGHAMSIGSARELLHDLSFAY